VKSTPAVVHLHGQRDGAYRTESLTTLYEEAFKEELVHCHECVVQNRVPLTNAADSRMDQVLLLDIVRAYRRPHQQ
jgi:hypothetical protein